MKDMDPSQIVGSGKEYTLNLHGGMQRKVIVTDVETDYPEGKLIVSCTNTEGIITKCNQAFVDMSGYTYEELVGQPHSILRHPDMPKAAFADLWTTVQAGNKWRGYVKNLRKDGGYYWVHAVVVPNVRAGKIIGYTSVRRKPSRTKIESSIPVYADLKAKEAS